MREKKKETMLLIGWTRSMMEMVRVGSHGGAEFSAHSCRPNSYFHSATYRGRGLGTDIFTVHGRFAFPHHFDFDDVRFNYDFVEFSFRPLFLHAEREIQVGGHITVDYGLNIVDYSDYHIRNEAIRRKKSHDDEIIRYNIHAKNRERLRGLGIVPIPCSCTACDDALLNGYARSLCISMATGPLMKPH